VSPKSPDGGSIGKWWKMYGLGTSWRKYIIEGMPLKRMLGTQTLPHALSVFSPP
jgi:hypothetical protein